MNGTVRCNRCESLELINDALRDRCGSLELINEGLNERAVAQLNVEPNTDLNGRVAILQLDRAVRRIAELEENLRRSEEALKQIESEFDEYRAKVEPGPSCPDCGSSEIRGDVRLGKDDEGYRSEEIYRCECGSTGPASEVKNAA